MAVATILRKVSHYQRLQKVAASRAVRPSTDFPSHLVNRYRFDPVAYVRDYFGWTPWHGTEDAPGQLELFNAYVLSLKKQHEKRDYENGLLTEAQLEYYTPGETIKTRLRVEAGHTVGKCVVKWDVITLANGVRVEAKELIGKTFELITLVNGKPQAVKAKAFHNDLEPVYELTTDSGKRLTRNAHHPLWVTDSTFRPGYRPVIPEGGWRGVAEIREGQLVAVAETLPAYGRARIADEKIKLLAYLIGDGGLTGNCVRFSQKEGPQLEEFKRCAEALGCRVEYVQQYDYIVYAERGRRGKNCNEVLNMAREFGIWGVGSLNKRIPPVIFELPKGKIQMFLSRLWSTDGWAAVGANGLREIGYGSSSEGLIRDVQHLLQRLGVHARLAYKPKVRSWTLYIKDASDQMAFAERVGIFGKEDALGRVAASARITRDRKDAQIAKRADRPRWCHKNAHPGTRWEKVVSVRQLKPEDTVAIEVPVHDTYLTEFWEHNTKGAAGLVNHFFDCFPPSIIYSYAPNFEQVKDLLWKEIRSDREGTELPGRMLSLRLERGPDHFATGKALNNQGGMGTERAQGQHGEYLMFVLDEAEGLPDFIYDAVDSMTSGGISITLMLANPKTRASRFYKVRTHSRVQNFRISCLNHPNVLAGREIIPQAVKRDYIEDMIEKGMKERGMAVVSEHDPDKHTFALPYSVKVDEQVFPAETIFEPDREFLFRVMGIAPGDATDNTLIPVGRYEAALARKQHEIDPAILEPTKARLGIDVARFGRDMGTGYIKYNGTVRRFAQFPQKNNLVYKATIKAELLRLHALGVRDVEVRVDGGGGFGGGVIDLLRADLELQRLFPRFVVYEVLFNGTPKDPLKYGDPITEMTDKAGEALKYLRLDGVPDVLLEDLTERTYDYALYKGVLEVRKLESKQMFKKRHQNRSPDDGDGFTLCAAPDYLFVQPKAQGQQSRQTSHSD